MRSPELMPRIYHAGYDDAACQVGYTRSWKLEDRDTPPETFPDLIHGRLMVFFPTMNLRDGYAELLSEGFFDGDNTPPWDTWIGYFDDRPERAYGYLLAYVPEPFLELANAGIEGNPEECIVWLSDAPVKMRDRLARMLNLPQS